MLRFFPPNLTPRVTLNVKRNALHAGIKHVDFGTFLVLFQRFLHKVNVCSSVSVSNGMELFAEQGSVL